MTRVILVAGKGGVGKTTVAAATGVAAAHRGYRTLVMSFDLAHSLSDSFDLHDALFSQYQGEPTAIKEQLEIQEIDVQEELERHWGDVYRYSATLMVGGGLEDVVAEEVAIMPGMEDIVALLTLNQHVQDGQYDLIVLDCPPTSDALRFVNFSSTLDWYARKRLKLDRKVCNLVRPMASMLTESVQQYIPDDTYFTCLQQLFERLDGVDQLLRDPARTSVRLVANPEKMVVRETQRAFMYFCMYGMITDAVVVNRLLPEGEGYFAEWAKSQSAYTQYIADYFEPVPVLRAPLLSHEVTGMSQLETFSQLLFEHQDPTDFFVQSPSYGFKKDHDEAYRLEIRLPSAPTDQIDITRHQEDFVVRLGTFKRNILLPRAIAALEVSDVVMDNDILSVHFTKE